MSATPESPAGWERIACPVCDGIEFTPLFRKQGEPFVRCGRCTLVLINPRRMYAELRDATYDGDYSRHYAGKLAKKLRRVRRWVRRVQRRYVRSGRWLDIGCSIGAVVKAAEERGFEAHGVDVEPWGVRYGRETLGLKRLRCGLLEDQQFPAGYFDVISLYDVIEHVPDLNRLAAELKRLLAKGGVIDLITPDVDHWRVPKRLADWPEIKPSEHLYYFSRATLTWLLKRHGLHIVKRRLSFKPALKVYIRHRPGD